MGTTIRSEVSKNNIYWIEKHRYYELKHFCLQYPIWKKTYAALEGIISTRPSEIGGLSKNLAISDPTAKCAMKKVYYANRMDMIRRTASQTDSIIGDYIFAAVTEGWSYDILKARLEIPCCKDTYYKLYRRFFWLLDKERQ